MPLLLLFGFLVSPVSAQQNPRALDPGDVFFQAWLETQRAEKLEKEHKFSQAWQKYRQAAKYYAVLIRYHKNWKPDLVQRVMERTQASIKEVEPKAAAELAGKKAKTRDLVEGGTRSKPNPTPPSNPGGSGHIKRPNPKPSPLTPPASRIASTDTRLQRRLKQLEQQNRALQLELNRIRKTTRTNPAEQQRLIDLIAKKDREINTMRDILARAPLEKDMQRLTREKLTRERELAITARALKKSQRQLKEAQKIAQKHQAENELAQRRIAQIKKDMENQGKTNNRVIRALRKELKTVSALLENTRKELGAANARIARMQRQLNEAQSTIKELTEERDALRVERDALVNVLKKSDSKGVQNLIAENMRLGRELKDAQERLEFIKNSQDVTKQELLQAKSDLAIAKTRIMRYQQSQKNHNQMIKSLETQLRDARAALANARTHPNSKTSQEEIEVLRGTVKRLIAAQERRRMSEKLLWETYRKSKVAIAGMDKVIDDIRNTKVTLSDEEKRIVALRQPDGEFRNPAHVPLSHARAFDDALQEEIATYTPLMKRAFEKGRFEAARQILMEMDERFPGHFPTLCNRGVVELKTNHYPEAEEIFHEAITMRENSSYAYYMLGLSQYKNNDLDNARNAFQHSLDLKPGNARAHLYLGIINAAGKRYKQAQKHFLTTIEIDPESPDAYFNLSVLHLQQHHKEKALEFYRKALDHGAKPDPAHEQRLSKK